MRRSQRYAFSLMVMMLATCTLPQGENTGSATVEPPPLPGKGPAVAAVLPAPPEQPPAEAPRQMDEVLAELDALRGEVREMRDVLDIYVDNLLEELRAQNTLLREEIARLHALSAPRQTPEGLWIPRPEFDDAFPPPQPEAPAPMPEPAPPALSPELAPPDAMPPVPAGQFWQQVIAEWGRTPEQAAKLGEGAVSLKAQVILVSQDATDDDLIGLGRDLRRRFDEFDNIHIEVFDDADAAKRYAEQQAMTLEHRVLSVSKYIESGNDVILLTRGGTVKPVELTQ